MSDTQHSLISEQLPSSEPSTQDLTSESMSTTETLVTADATPTEALLPECIDKDSTNSSTTESSKSSHRDKAVEAFEKLNVDTSAEKQHAGDPMFELGPSRVTHSYVVPEIIRPLDKYQRGYARMAAVLNCDPNFSIVRKYGWLHSRVLLHLQVELEGLEDDLQKLDDVQAERARFNEDKGHWCERLDKSPRKKLLAKIKPKLAEYDDLVHRLQRKNAMKRPTSTNQNSVMQGAFQSFAGFEAEWTCQTEDLVALADDAAEQYWFNFCLYYARLLAPRLFRGIFQSRERRIKSGSLPYTRIYSPTRIDALYRTILTLAGTAIVLGPISVAGLLSRNLVLTIYTSTLGFSIFCAVFTKASRGQVFAATGGYCALQVIVMLLGSHVK